MKATTRVVKLCYKSRLCLRKDILESELEQNILYMIVRRVVKNVGISLSVGTGPRESVVKKQR